MGMRPATFQLGSAAVRCYTRGTLQRPAASHTRSLSTSSSKNLNGVTSYHCRCHSYGHHSRSLLGRLSSTHRRLFSSSLPRLVVSASTTVSSTSTTNMSESARKFFVVYAPDYTDEGTFERRMSVRERHLARASTQIQNGGIKVAGGMLTPESVETPTSTKKIIGSTFIFEAENIQVVRDWIESDLYYTSNIWDKERLVILPFLPATKL